ncbi:MAG: hypothetical protein IKL17_01030, partial [Alistipes sp.]|nr:hypothetical protein [Alistipes sp.]
SNSLRYTIFCRADAETILAVCQNNSKFKIQDSKLVNPLSNIELDKGFFLLLGVKGIIKQSQDCVIPHFFIGEGRRR